MCMITPAIRPNLEDPRKTWGLGTVSKRCGRAGKAYAALSMVSKMR